MDGIKNIHGQRSGDNLVKLTLETEELARRLMENIARVSKASISMAGYLE